MELQRDAKEFADRGHTVAEAFTEIAQTLSSHACLQDLLEEVVSKVRRLFDVRRCSVFLLDSRTGLYQGKAAEDLGDPTAREIVGRISCGMPADGFTLELVASCRPVLIKNARLDARPVRTAVHRLDLFEVLGVPLLAKGEVIGLIFLDNPGERNGFGEEDQRIATALGGVIGMAVHQLRGTEELRESAAKVARHNKFLQRGRAMQERLTQLALESSSIQGIADGVLEVTGEPCLVYDPDMRRLGSGLPADQGEPVRTILDAGVGTPTEVEQALATVADGGPAMIGPFPRAGLHRRAILAPIRARDRNCGYVLISETSRRLNSLDVGVAKQAASIVAVEFSASQRDSFLDIEARDALIRDLLDGAASPHGLRERILHHGLRMDERYVVALFLALEGCKLELSCSLVDAALNGSGLGSAAAATAIDERTVVSLIPLGTDHPTPGADRRIKESVTGAAALLSADGEVLAAISSPCRMPTECSVGFREARRLLECIETATFSCGNVLAAEDLGAARLLLGAVDGDEAGRFAEQTLGPLLDTESARGAELLETLAAFVGCGRSVRNAALRLGVHENTIRYRLSRIADLTGLDAVLQPDHQLTCQLAIAVLQLQGRLAPREMEPAPAADAAESIA